jgi:hypothetical protein
MRVASSFGNQAYWIDMLVQTMVTSVKKKLVSKLLQSGHGFINDLAYTLVNRSAAAGRKFQQTEAGKLGKSRSSGLTGFDRQNSCNFHVLNSH